MDYYQKGMDCVGEVDRYLIFSDDTVFNIRSNEGVVIDLSFL